MSALTWDRDGMQGSQLAALERAWHEQEGATNDVSAAAAEQAAHVPNGTPRLGAASARRVLPGSARVQPGGQLDTIPEEAAAMSEGFKGVAHVEPIMRGVTGSQQHIAPSQRALKRQKTSKRPLLSESHSEGF